MIVLDACALIEVLLRTKIGAPIERRRFAPGETLHAPDLIDIETTQVLRRHVAQGPSTRNGNARLSRTSRRWRFAVMATRTLLPRVWEMRDNLNRLRRGVRRACAGAERCPFSLATLLTCDRRLAAAAGHRARIEAMRGLLSPLFTARGRPPLAPPPQEAERGIRRPGRAGAGPPVRGRIQINRI